MAASKRILAAIALTLWVVPADSGTVVFEDVCVLPMDGVYLREHSTVVVRDGLIERIGDAAAAANPEDAVVVSGKGRFLMPGLAEMHGHIPSPPQSDSYRDRVLQLYVAAGVTTVRGMLGHPSHLELRAQLENGEVLGPRLFTSGPSFSGRSVSSAREVVNRARTQQKMGYDFLKIHPGLTPEQFDALVATARELGMPFAGHVSTLVGIEKVLQAGQASVDHLDGYMHALVPSDNMDAQRGQAFFGVRLADDVDETLIAPLAQATAGAGVWNVPTQSLFEHVVLPVSPDTQAAWPEMKYMPPQTVRQWVASKRSFVNDPDYDAGVAQKAAAVRRTLILELQKAGAGLLLGSDAPQVFNVPGFAAHRELKMLVESGLTPYQALVTGTLNPAKFFRAADRFGTVREGQEADLILLEANPLEDIDNISKIAGVMVRGRWLPREELDRLLARWHTD